MIMRGPCEVPSKIVKLSGAVGAEHCLCWRSCADLDGELRPSVGVFRRFSALTERQTEQAGKYGVGKSPVIVASVPLIPSV